MDSRDPMQIVSPLAIKWLIEAERLRGYADKSDWNAKQAVKDYHRAKEQLRVSFETLCGLSGLSGDHSVEQHAEEAYRYAAAKRNRAICLEDCAHELEVLENPVGKAE